MRATRGAVDSSAGDGKLPHRSERRATRSALQPLAPLRDVGPPPIISSDPLASRHSPAAVPPAPLVLVSNCRFALSAVGQTSSPTCWALGTMRHTGLF